MKISLLLVIVGLTLANCSEHPFQPSPKDIEVQFNDTTLDVSNNSENEIYYFAVDQEFAAVASWTPISDEENIIQAQADKKIPHSEIEGYSPEGKVILYYWSSRNPSQNEIRNLVISR